LNTEIPNQDKENPVLTEVQRRLPDKILAGGFFTQEIATGNLGKFLLGAGFIIGAFITYLITAIIVVAAFKNLSGWFITLMGGFAGASAVQAIYNAVIAKSRQRKGQLPNKIFLAVSLDQINAFNWQAGWNKLHVKAQIATWPRAGIKVERSTSKKDPLDNSTRPALVFHIPNMQQPLVLLYSNGAGEMQVADLLCGILKAEPATAKTANPLLEDPKVIQFYQDSAAAWTSGKITPFLGNIGAENLTSDVLFDEMMKNPNYLPAEGNTVHHFFTQGPHLPDEFFVTTGPNLVLTNKRLMIQNGDPAKVTELNMAEVASCNLAEAKQGVLHFVMKSGEAITLSNIKGYPKTLDKNVEQGLFAG
jgi:hypothetical protein